MEVPDMPDTSRGDQLIEEIINSEFSYDPESDPAYKTAVDQASQGVINEMVQRGGLYSSVAQNALATRMMDLQGVFYDRAYQKYSDERAFKLNLAQLAYSREDEQWNRYIQALTYNADRGDEAWRRQLQAAENIREEKRLDLAYAQYQADREDEAFDRQRAINAENRANAQFALQKQMVQLEVQQQQMAGQLQGEALRYQVDSAAYDQFYSEWRKTGSISSQAAAFLGVSPSANSMQIISSFRQKRKAIEATGQNVEYLSSVTGDYSVMMDAAKQTMAPVDSSEFANLTADQIMNNPLKYVGSGYISNLADAQAKIGRITTVDGARQMIHELDENMWETIGSVGESGYKVLVTAAQDKMNSLMNNNAPNTGNTLYTSLITPTTGGGGGAIR